MIIINIAIPSNEIIDGLNLMSLRGTSTLIEEYRVQIAQAARRVNDRIAELEEKERLARGPNPRGVSRVGV